jgi:hypothetical protein
MKSLILVLFLVFSAIVKIQAQDIEQMERELMETKIRNFEEQLLNSCNDLSFNQIKILLDGTILADTINFIEFQKPIGYEIQNNFLIEKYLINLAATYDLLEQFQIFLIRKYDSICHIKVMKLTKRQNNISWDYVDTTLIEKNDSSLIADYNLILDGLIGDHHDYLVKDFDEFEKNIAFTNRMDVGTLCYFQVEEPEGFKRLIGFLEKKDTDSLYSWLVSQDPPKQVYAVIGYNMLSKNGYEVDESTKKIIEYVYRKKDLIKTCNGCILYIKKVNEYLEEYFELN